MVVRVPIHVYELAEDLCTRSNVRQKMSAVIFKNDTIIGRGYNMWLRTSPNKSTIYGVPVHSIHAEIMAIRWAYKKYGTSKFLNAYIYVHRSGNRLAKPCTHCAHVIDMFGLTPIWSPIYQNV